jgi:hypothetical protein
MSDTTTKAFPSENDADKRYNYINKGMNLRDYFAAKVLEGAVAKHGIYDIIPTDMVRAAYFLADAMMEAGEK